MERINLNSPDRDKPHGNTIYQLYKQFNIIPTGNPLGRSLDVIAEEERLNDLLRDSHRKHKPKDNRTDKERALSREIDRLVLAAIEEVNQHQQLE